MAYIGRTPSGGSFAKMDDISSGFNGSANTFSLSKYLGKVFVLDFSAGWWGPCFSDIPEGEELYQYWEHEDRLEIIHFLYDLNQPYRPE